MSEERVCMTPAKRGSATVMHIERKRVSDLDTRSIEASDQRGLVVNNAAAEGTGPRVDDVPELQLEFKCHLVDASSGEKLQQVRRLRYFFAANLEPEDKLRLAQDFFRVVVGTRPFPREAERFILRVMKTCQKDEYAGIKRCDCELEVPISEAQLPPPEPVDTRTPEQRLQDDLLLTLEYAFPNLMSLDELARLTGQGRDAVLDQLNQLLEKNAARPMVNGTCWVRNVVDNTTEVEVVKNMPILQRALQPTIAVITLMYAEKLAVDAMMEDRKTYVRYKTEGESNVYTLGYIGHRRVVSTKLPAIGRNMTAQIASGNSTTRLLGTFSEIEHVFLVGVGGGVPQYADFNSHVRLGDIVVSVPDKQNKLYYFCEKVLQDEATGEINFTLKSWGATDPILSDIITDLREQGNENPGFAPWQDLVDLAQAELSEVDIDFSRPPPSSDRLFMSMGDNVIEVQPPPPPQSALSWFDPSKSQLRFGTVGASKPIVTNDNLKADFARRFGISAFDMEFDQVIESVCGNRKDSFLFIRGIADYHDGSKGKEWQPYASLMAACLMKYLINQLPKP